ncbi:MAG: hypothetical protein Tsb002_25910 [Wenzhouxiangellaceae bacterium]
MPGLLGRLLLGMVVLLATACQGDTSDKNQRLLQAYKNGETDIWVSGTGPVTQIFGDDQISGVAYQRFYADLNGEIPVLINYQVTANRRIPVAQGDQVAFEGSYEWRAEGGVIYVRQRDDGLRGWVEHDGVRYQ